jgi:hypothetical protein
LGRFVPETLLANDFEGFINPPGAEFSSKALSSHAERNL